VEFCAIFSPWARGHCDYGLAAVWADSGCGKRARRPRYTSRNPQEPFCYGGRGFGVASYGNCFGVPNLGGEVKFEPCYSGNPLVNAFALGWCAAIRSFTTRIGEESGNLRGSKTGRDGIHGATMASEEFSEVRKRSAQRSSRRSIP